MLLRTTTNHINLPQQKTFTYHSPLPFLNLHSRNYFLTTSRWRPPRSGFFPVGESLNIINSIQFNSRSFRNGAWNPGRATDWSVSRSLSHVSQTARICILWEFTKCDISVILFLSERALKVQIFMWWFITERDYPVRACSAYQSWPPGRLARMHRRSRSGLWGLKLDHACSLFLPGSQVWRGGGGGGWNSNVERKPDGAKKNGLLELAPRQLGQWCAHQLQSHFHPFDLRAYDYWKSKEFLLLRFSYARRWTSQVFPWLFWGWDFQRRGQLLEAWVFSRRQVIDIGRCLSDKWFIGYGHSEWSYEAQPSTTTRNVRTR